MGNLQTIGKGPELTHKNHGMPLGFCDVCIGEKALKDGLIQAFQAGNARGMYWMAGDWVDPILLREWKANIDKVFAGIVGEK